VIFLSVEFKRDELSEEIKNLRRDGWRNPTSPMSNLLAILGYKDETRWTEVAEGATSRLIMLIQKYSGKDTERILLALGLLEGYEFTDAEGIKERHERYFATGFPHREVLDIDASLRKDENTAIAHLVKKLVPDTIPKRRKDEISEIITSAPPKVFYPRPDYPYKDSHGRKKRSNIPDETITTEIKGDFARYIDNEKSRSDVQYYKLDYRSNKIPFYPRATEFEALDRFRDDDRQVLWWGVIGSGGSGKSRLAYEYVKTLNESRPDEWKAMFLPDSFFRYAESDIGKYRDFDNWDYPKHLLLAVDYVQRHTKDVAQWIEELVRTKSDAHKIRILLLDRYGADGLWYGDFMEKAAVAGCRYTDLYELGSLDDLSVFARQYIEEQSADVADDEIKAALDKLPQIDKERRVLYFVMILDAVLDKQPDWRAWNKDQVLNYILTREIRVIESRFRGKNKAFKSYMRLLLYATLTKELGTNDLPEQIEKDYIEIIDGFPDRKSAHKAMGAEGGIIRPLTPDLIGEYFALFFWDEYLPLKSQQEPLVSTAWAENPLEISDFLFRVWCDFGRSMNAKTRTAIGNIFKNAMGGSPVNNEDAFLAECAQTLFFMTDVVVNIYLSADPNADIQLNKCDLSILRKTILNFSHEFRRGSLVASTHVIYHDKKK
jgi:hypothetical protein